MTDQSQAPARGFSASIIQRGFTLLEMVVTLSIIAILATVIGTHFSGDAAKATKILSDSASFKKAFLQYELDTGRLPGCFEQLWRRDSACVGLIASGSAVPPRLSSWSGPYLDKYPGLNNSGTLIFDGYSMAYATASSGYGGAPALSGALGFYLLRIPHVSSSLAFRLMEKCTGNDYLAWAASDFSAGNCRVAGPFSDDTYHFEYFVGYRR